DIYLTQNYNPQITASEGIDLNEDNQYNKLPFGQRYWTGVWKHRAKSIGGDNPGANPFPENLETAGGIPSDTMHDPDYDPHPAIESAWLVSGNEGYDKKLAVLEGSGTFAARSDYIEIPDGIPQNGRNFTVNGMSYGQDENAWADYQLVVQDTFSNRKSDTYDPQYHHPLVELPDPESDQYPDETVWILKKPLLKDSYDPENPQDWKNHLAGEPIKVRKTKFMMADDESGVKNGESAYAYWVGDEGIKTKANIVNPNKGENIWDDLAVATEPNLETGYGISFASSIEEERQKILSLGMFAEIDDVSGDPTEKSDSMAAHYHGLTTDSFGVLADVRTGGLKRDLSSAFSIEDQEIWDDDFEFLFKDRVMYLKTIPLKYSMRNGRIVTDSRGNPLPPKDNEWRDTGDSHTIIDKNFILAGPRWDVLKDFHDKWKSLKSSNKLLQDQIYPDNFPRVTGDPHAILDAAHGQPTSRSGEIKPKEWHDYINLFPAQTLRPEPTNHSIVPTLVEFKFSAIPYWTSDNYLALAMHPSVAFWNPYNLSVNLDNIFIEVPLNVFATAFNPKEWDLFLHWYKHNPAPSGDNSFLLIPDDVTTSDSSLPTDYLDLNGNGVRDPGEPRKQVPTLPPDVKLPPGGGAGGSPPPPSPPSGTDPKPNFIYFFDRSSLVWGNFELGKVAHPQQKLMECVHKTFGDFRRSSEYSAFPSGEVPHYAKSDSDGIVRKFHFFRSNNQKERPEKAPQPQERVLLLHIPVLNLEAGEKAHFSISQDRTLPWEKLEDESTSTKKLYIDIELRKQSESFAQALICKTEYSQPIDEPITVFFAIDGYRGVDSSAREDFDMHKGTRMESSKFYKPQGITIYGNDPRKYNLTKTKLLRKISKGYSNLEIHSGLMDFKNPSILQDSLNLNGGDKIHGNGFRIRWKLPGSPDDKTSVLFNQHNPRALVDSMQDGYGDNWKFERYLGSKFKNKRKDWSPYCKNAEERVQFYFPARMNEALDPAVDFVSLQNQPPTAFERMFLSNAIVPKAGINSGVGFFHDVVQIGSAPDQMKTKEGDTAVMFDLPREPLLSIGQFKHANLNHYSHGPSYIFGNSYATPQVGRHKTWTRFSALKQHVTHAQGSKGKVGGTEIQKMINKLNFDYTIPGGTLSFRFFPWDSNKWEPTFAAIRDENSASNHENITFDHSYYANYALSDGYFLTGHDGDHDGDDFTTIPNNIEAGQRFLPFRNPRLVPYLRDGSVENGKWKLTSYDQNRKVKVGPTKNKDFRYQSLAGDLLLEGAFNVNSTSVNAWVAHLSALKGIRIPGSSMPPNETPFPRFFDEIDENSWNKVCSLSDSEINNLAKSLVKQIKLRGPFLSYADFVNRRILVESKPHPLNHHFTDWQKETRNSALSLSGAVQSAIADAEINLGGFSSKKQNGDSNPLITQVPASRFKSSVSTLLDYHFLTPKYLEASNFLYSRFGFHAINKSTAQLPFGSTRINSEYSLPAITNPYYSDKDNNLKPAYFPQYWGKGAKEFSIKMENTEHPYLDEILWYEIKMKNYEQSYTHGEAPENLLAVENVATAANKPGWLMQADVLTPLAPVSSVRSDTFVIRVMGESPSINDQPFSSRAWIELTVQRVPDYIKSELDSPHHRPHEPFEDANFDGIWNGDEHWLDLNKNSLDEDGKPVNNAGKGPDLPGVGSTEADKEFADGLKTDLKLNGDEWEEPLSDKGISYQGINQRFGRKFKIVKFRWLNENDV
ncbi:MAG: hypothetical protein ISR37_05465, partial [Balneolaceae bacterium]|nr:hypothetical protein [Balneolaceae bacterium]